MSSHDVNTWSTSMTGLSQGYKSEQDLNLPTSASATLPKAQKRSTSGSSKVVLGNHVVANSDRISEQHDNEASDHVVTQSNGITGKSLGSPLADGAPAENPLTSEKASDDFDVPHQQKAIEDMYSTGISLKLPNALFYEGQNEGSTGQKEVSPRLLPSTREDTGEKGVESATSSDNDFNFGSDHNDGSDLNDGSDCDDGHNDNTRRNETELGILSDCK